MNKSFIEQSITIHAPISSVWNVLVKKKYIEEWIKEFSAGNLATEDWRLHSQISMTDNDGKLILQGTITEFNPNQNLKLEFENSEYQEELTLISKGNSTVLSCHAGPVSSADHKKHSEVWEKGLNKMKELAEGLH